MRGRGWGRTRCGADPGLVGQGARGWGRPQSSTDPGCEGARGKLSLASIQGWTEEIQGRGARGRMATSVWPGSRDQGARGGGGEGGREDLSLVNLRLESGEEHQANFPPSHSQNLGEGYEDVSKYSETQHVHGRTN